MNPIVSLKHVRMEYNLMEENVDTLKDYILRLIKGNLKYNRFIALEDINFDLYEGDILGIIGYNGAGKSTLLKLIAGVVYPTKGTVNVQGKIAPLIEVGAGFDPELTARENIFLNGAMLGYDKKILKESISKIIEFAELEKFENVPIKNFSSGMYARLGFAVATIINPDILIVDEVLSVGDFKFQEKCKGRILEMIESGTTIIMVSHDINLIESTCNKVLWLEKGKQKHFGDTHNVCKAYKNGM